MGVCLASGGLPELALAGSRVAEADKQRRDPKQFISNQRGITLRFSYLSSLSMLSSQKDINLHFHCYDTQAEQTLALLHTPTCIDLTQSRHN